jgi:cobalt-zinc-cadmium efflux system protein
MSHSHNHIGGHGQGHVHPAPAASAAHDEPAPPLLVALLLTAGFAGIEGLAGWWTGSLALLADAGHMVTDSASLALALFAAWLARRPPSRRHSYGLGQAEVLAAFVNALAMLAVVVAIAAEAWERFGTPRAIDGPTVSVVAVVGLLVNLAVAWTLTRGESNLNVRAALLHVLGDALGSVAAIAAGLVIWTTGWTPIDPLLSVLICGLILSSTVGLLKESTHTLLDGVPLDLSLEAIGQGLARVPGVTEVHDLHVWSLSPRRIALSAHVTVPDLTVWPATLVALRQAATSLGIDHATFQPESTAQPIVWLAERPGASRRPT